MAFKGRIVIDHFMELKHATPKVRNLMRAYFYVLPTLTVLVSLFGEYRPVSREFFPDHTGPVADHYDCSIRAHRGNR